MLDEPGRERGGDHTTDEQRAGVGEVDSLATEGKQEAERTADSNHELRGVDGPDDLARLEATRGQQRGGFYQAPATSADRVHEAADHAEWCEEKRGDLAMELGTATAQHEEAHHHIHPEGEQEACQGLAVSPGMLDRKVAPAKAPIPQGWR